MALTGQGGQSGGPQYGWGGVGNDPSVGARTGSGGSRSNFNSGLNSGRYTAGPEAGMRRGAWQWSGHGPSAQRDYGWDYQGGVGRDEAVMRTEARDGGSYLSHMAQDRGGGLPRYHDDYDVGDRWFSRLGERAEGRSARDYDRGFRGGMGGGGMYDRGYQARGGTLGGGGNRQGFGGRYGGDYRGEMNRGGERQVTYGFGGRQGGGYGRDFGGRQGGGYGDDAIPPRLTDAEFYSRVNRW
jgi:23S rRNA pseudouridine2605 synthase